MSIHHRKRRPPPPRHDPAATATLWASRAFRAVLALGTLAAAIGSILALKPKPFPEPKPTVQFGEIALDHLPMRAYQARVVHEQGGGGRAGGVGAIVLTAAGFGAVAQADTPSGTAVYDEHLSIPLPAGRSAEKYATDTRQIVQQADQELDGPSLSDCVHKTSGTCDALAFLCTIVAVDAKGRRITQEAAARKLVAMLRSVRAAGSGAPGTWGPAGVLVSAKLRIVNEQGRQVAIHWSVYDEEQRLGLLWTTTHQSLLITPRHTDDRIVATLWLPLPKRRGHYHVRLDAYVRGELVDFGHTGTFR
jgi:hypothetical protein